MSRTPRDLGAPEQPLWLPQEAQRICPFDAVPDGAARGFTLHNDDGDRLDIIIWRDGAAIYGFVNQCPHLGLPLETFPDRFLAADANSLICSAHGAQFDRSGACFHGPCKGRALVSLSVSVVDKHIVLNAPRGHS